MNDFIPLRTGLFGTSCNHPVEIAALFITTDLPVMQAIAEVKHHQFRVENHQKLFEGLVTLSADQVRAIAERRDVYFSGNYASWSTGMEQVFRVVATLTAEQIGLLADWAGEKKETHRVKECLESLLENEKIPGVND